MGGGNRYPKTKYYNTKLTRITKGEGTPLGGGGILVRKYYLSNMQIEKFDKNQR